MYDAARVAGTADRFRTAVESGDLDLPLPGSGATFARWRALARIAAEDLCVARLAEAHTDAVATMAELHAAPPRAGTRWGLWAARPPGPGVTAQREGSRWALTGTKPWCSGARACTHALVTADAPDGYRLFAVDLSCGAVPLPSTWATAGMAGSDTSAVEFRGVPATAVGDPDAYLARPGFWLGAIAVAACWYGGAVGLARGLLPAAGEQSSLGPHALAHLGAIDGGLAAARASLVVAAGEIDAGTDGATSGEHRAARVRAIVERVALDVLDRVGRAGGPALLVGDPRYGNLFADLPVYLRQSHAERDLERLGTLAASSEPGW